MIATYAKQDDWVDKYKNLLDELKWSDDLSPRPGLVKAFPCDINRGVMDNKGILLPMMANIYVNDILAATAHRENMIRLCVGHPILHFDSVPSPSRSGTN